MTECERVRKIEDMTEKILKIFGIEPDFNSVEYQRLYILLKNNF